jgi:hypothetical protein
MLVLALPGVRYTTCLLNIMPLYVHNDRMWPCLAALQALSSSSSSNMLPAGQQQLWLPDKSALQQAGVSGWSFVPEGVQSALLQALPGGKQLLLVLAERPR